MILTGGRKYQIKGRAGQGGFAQVYKASVISNPDEIVALKVISTSCSPLNLITEKCIPLLSYWDLLQIQKPPFPWEFYMYRQLDQRISAEEVCCFLVSLIFIGIRCFCVPYLFFIFHHSCYQRSCFGHAERIHLYSDCSILVCDYLANGTLQVGLLYCMLYLNSLGCHYADMKIFCRML